VAGTVAYLLRRAGSTTLCFSLLDAETRSVPSVACTEHQTSASPAEGWPHRFNKCGARAFAHVAGQATAPAPAVQEGRASGGVRCMRAVGNQSKPAI